MLCCSSESQKWQEKQKGNEHKHCNLRSLALTSRKFLHFKSNNIYANIHLGYHLSDHIFSIFRGEKAGCCVGEVRIRAQANNEAVCLCCEFTL